MKKTWLLSVAVFIFMIMSIATLAQYYVPTESLNKNAILEEFTGVKCPNCPSGHQVMATILAANPGRAFAVAFHPFNSSYTLPYAGDPDFRRHYADSLYMTPYCGTSRYMPSAFVNRRLWAPPERLTQRTNWTGFTNTILAETSPLNVGMATVYDEFSKVLTVVVDIYYTAALANAHNLMVTLAENNLVSQQSGASGQYTHKHTFRESFVGQWGDPINSGGGPGTYYRRIFTFNNADSNYIMSNCELTAYVIDNTSAEVITGIGCNVGDTTFIPPSTLSITQDTLQFITSQHCTEGLTTTLFNATLDDITLTYVEQEGFAQFPWHVYPWPFAGFPYVMAPNDSIDLTVYIILPLDVNQEGFLYDTLTINTETDTHYVILAADERLFMSAGDKAGLPASIQLSNYPNPFSGSTMITVSLPAASPCLLEVYNLNGQRMKLIRNGELTSGIHNISWDGTDDNGNLLPGGIYFMQLKSSSAPVTKRCMLIR